MKIGDHVRVTSKLLQFAESADKLVPHPHAGKTGVVTEVLGVYVRISRPRAVVRIDDGQQDAGNFMVVSLDFLEPA